MDDPWGSPWASADGAPQLSSQLPPPTFASKALDIPSLPTQSPWADNDDDAFGDWADADTSAAFPPKTTALNAPVSGPTTVPTAPETEFGKLNPVSSRPASTSPRILPQPITTNLPLQPSIDPWSAGSTLSGEEALHVPKFPLNSDWGHQSKQFVGHELDSGVASGVAKESRPWEAESPGHTAQDQETESEAGNDDGGHEVAAKHLELKTRDAEEKSPPTPSPPASPAVTHNDSVETASATTANYDATPEPQIPRPKEASKVQELVELYDGLADKIDYTVDAKPEPNVSEEENTAGRESSNRLKKTESPTVVMHDTGTVTASSPDHVAPPVGIQRLGFSVDFHRVDELFSPKALSLNDKVGSPAQLDDYIPDHVLSDSFTAISERKTWYRISRQGSSRKHNAGDDDNYRLITWATSTVRVDTIQIVRRWMEEDSFYGKPTLGGNSIGGNMFGWNSAAKPVALNEVFKRKSVERRPVSSGSYLSFSSTTESSAMTDKTVSSPTSMFTWSSQPAPIANTPTSPRKGIPSPIEVRETKAATLSKSTPIRRPSTNTETSPASVSQDKPQLNAVNEKDDDDEWGDMISSPVSGPNVFTAPVIETVIQRSHDVASRKASDDFDGPNSTHGPPDAVGAASVREEEERDPQPTSGLNGSSGRVHPTDLAANREKQEILIESILRGLPDLSYMSK